MRPRTLPAPPSPPCSASLLAGCSPVVSLEPAADANNPDCAAAIVRLPDTVGSSTIRQTDAQATAAWGDPTGAAVCGVPVPEVSDLPCIDKGIFWLRDDSDDAVWQFTTYGRDPAITLIVDRDIASGPASCSTTSRTPSRSRPRTAASASTSKTTVTGADLDTPLRGYSISGARLRPRAISSVISSG